MLRLCVATLCVILPVVLSQENPGRTQASTRVAEYNPSSVGTGAAGLNYGQTQAGSETHDNKNFGLNFSSDKGASNQYSNTGVQAGAAGSLAQGYPSVYPNYPIYAGGYPPVYPHYPGYPGVVGAGVGVQVPGVNAGAGSGVYPTRMY